MSVDDMNEVLVGRHNAVVRPDDLVIHLGDFAWTGNPNHVKSWLDQLNGEHVLVSGNHDRTHPMHSKSLKATRQYKEAGFKEVYEKHILEIPGFGSALLSHFPRFLPDLDLRFPEWRIREEDMVGKRVLFHGHVHEKWKVRENAINVGVDQWDFAPVALDVLLEYLQWT